MIFEYVIQIYVFGPFLNLSESVVSENRFRLFSLVVFPCLFIFLFMTLTFFVCVKMENNHSMIMKILDVTLMLTLMMTLMTQ